MNDNLCFFCGAELVDGKCPNAASHIVKMCINCEFCGLDNDSNRVCYNAENMENAIEKVKAALPSGYDFVNLELKPLPLKEPTKKCKKWAIVDKKIADIIGCTV